MGNLENVTVQDCMDMWTHKGCPSIINDGKVVGFENGNRIGETYQAPQMPCHMGQTVYVRDNGRKIT